MDEVFEEKTKMKWMTFEKNQQLYTTYYTKYIIIVLTITNYQNQQLHTQVIVSILRIMSSSSRVAYHLIEKTVYTPCVRDEHNQH